MNIVEMLKEQLKGDVHKTLVGLIGAKGKDMEKILDSVVPSVLSGLGAVASSKVGADKIASSIDGFGKINLSDISHFLDGESMSEGSKLLGGLFGSEVVDGIVESLAKFTGIHTRIVKKAIGFLTPVILATVGSTFAGAKLDGSVVAKLFDDQKSNIADALPPGFTLNSVAGFKELASTAEQVEGDAVSGVGKGFGQLLVPIAVVVSIVAAVFFFANNAEKASAWKSKGSSATDQASTEPNEVTTTGGSAGTANEEAGRR